MSQRNSGDAGVAVKTATPAAADAAETKRLARILQDQLPIDVYDGNRLVGQMTGVRYTSSRIHANIETTNVAVGKVLRPDTGKQKGR